ncbi:MAG: EpsI family protein [Candidatus Omnitrophica bacterium]|nr:EpsI family protein [Candidatus Omnitrophota bacterium]
MSFGRKHYLIVVIILAAASVLVLKIERRKVSTHSLADFGKLPFEIGNWQGKNLDVSQDVYEILETEDILIRQYKDKEGDSLTLAIVYSGNRRETFHPPEICYLGGGTKLLEKTQEKIPLDNANSLKTNKLVMKTAKGGIIKAWYWFVAGDRFISNYYLQQVYFLLDAIKGKELKGALIRISAQGDSPVLEGKTEAFIREILPDLRKIF